MSGDELPVDLTTSHARRVEGGVRLVLGVSQPPADARELRLTSRKRAVVVPFQAVHDGVVEVQVPAEELPAGVWRLSLVVEGQPVALGARLVANRRQPVALLPGPTPTTRMAPPEPETREVPGSPGVIRHRVRHAAGKVADTGLAVLPEPRRTKVRSRLVRLGRRVLG